MMADKNISIWLLLLIAIVLGMYWHIKENNQLSRQWKENFNDDIAHWLIRFAWSRTVQFLLALICCSLIIVVYDWQLSGAHRSVQEAEKLNAEKEKKIVELTEQKKLAEAAILHNPMPNAIENNEGAQTNPSSGQVADSNQPTTTTYFASGTKKTNNVTDIYDPESNMTGKQSALDNLKRRYEEILVTYFFMERCKRTSQNDFHVIISALSQEMASINAPGRLQYDIVNSAKGSYKEMYARSSCSDSDVATLYNQYSNYITSLSANFAVKQP